MAATSTHLYWTSSDEAEPALRRIPFGGKFVIEDLSPPADSGNLELLGDTLAWTTYTTGEISKYTISNSMTTPLADVSGMGPWGLSFSGQHIYFAEHHGGTGEITRVRTGGGPFEVLVNDQDGPHQIVADGNILYWTNQFAGTVMRLEVGGIPTVIADGQDEALGLALTSGAIFWTTGDGKVMRLARE